MKCEHTTEGLEDYLDALLPAPERQELEQHLRTCARCRHDLEQRRALRLHLADLPVPQPAPGALESMLRAAVRSAPAPRPRWQHPGWFGSALATAAVLLVALGIRLGMELPGVKSAGPEVVLTAQPVELGATVQRVALVFRTKDAMPDADISMWLPDDVQIEGRPHLRHISWHTDLKQGPNLLELPLLATGTRGGTLVVQLSGGSLVRRLEVPIKVRAPKDPGAVSNATQSASAGLGA
jgi:Putative zinc-finger